MSQWTDRVKEHAVFTELGALGPVIDRTASRWGIDAAAISAVERIRSVLTYCGKRIAAADPNLIAPRTLTAIANAMAATRTELEAYNSDSNAAHLDTANAQADEALAAIGAIASVDTPDDLTWINESAGAYRATVEQHLQETLARHAEILTALEAARKGVNEANTELTAIKEKLSTAAADQQTQFSTAQDARATEFATAQNDRQTKHAAAMSEFQTAFSNAQNERQAGFTASTSEQQMKFSADQEARNKTFAAAETERAEKYASLHTQYTSTLEEYTKELTRLRESAAKAAEEALAALRTQYESAARQILEKIEEHKTQVEKLVGVIGNLGVTSGYQITANRAQKAAYLWQFLTVASLAGLIWVAYVIAFAPPISESLFVQGLSTRIFLSLAIGIFAAYSARQAANNLDIERKNRRLALELEALGPFIAPLPADMQNKFRADVGDRSFGIPDGGGQRPLEKDPVVASDLIPLLREALAELTKRGK